jgi:hypothetical protein
VVTRCLLDLVVVQEGVEKWCALCWHCLALWAQSQAEACVTVEAALFCSIQEEL